MQRREFLYRTRAVGCGVAAGLTILPHAASARGAPANQRVSLAVVGLRNRGLTLATGFAQQAGCRILYLCDADGSLKPTRIDSTAKAQGGEKPKFVQDFRHALDDAAVDAVVVATPDHWHCLAAIWACQANKDVFVAAPLSHNIWEGQRAVAAARQTGRIVAADLACRSSEYVQSAKKYIADGKLGKVHLCRVFAQTGQSNFPAVADTAPPAELDWNAWNGPAPAAAYNANLQNNWHGYWRYSGGNAAVDGIHQLDLARWICGLEYPQTVSSRGARYDTAGVNETPDTLVTVFQFENLLMTFDLTLGTPYMTRVSPAVRAGDLFPYWPQCGGRVEVYGSEGVMYIAPHGTGWQVFGRPRREQPTLIERVWGKPVDLDHQQNFIAAIRARKSPSVDAAEAHRSALLVHYANMSYRVAGQTLRVDAKTEAVDSLDAMKYFRRAYRAPWVVE